MKIELPGSGEDMRRVERYLWGFFPPSGQDDPVDEVLHAVLDAPGKRLRPQLLLLVSRLGADHAAKRERLCKLAAIVECIHTASLIHDDIVDDSPLRRGRPTIQSRFGKDMAVYTGDLVLSRVMTELFADGLSQSGLVLGQTMQTMCRGELWQYAGRYRVDVTPDRYRKAIYGKTVALLAAACRVGGLESGCTAPVLEAVEDYGTHLGYLFQIRDDLLDFLSEQDREGKPVHVDFQEGILTLPVIYALAHPDHRQAIERLVGIAAERPLTAEEQALLVQAVRLSGGLEKAIYELDQHYACACAALKALPDGKIAAVLRKIVKMLRDSLPNKRPTAKMVAG
ncbi:MAG: polyprenyl synthetase family protein [Eubacteriales bacterium]|nr:polyprenyl synthetase family protein [Eubacteriales bacterium]